MAALGTVFLANLLLSFGIGLLLSGLFGAYFGRGKSRSVGLVLALVALLLLGLFAGLTWDLVPGIQPIFDTETMTISIVAVTAALLGTLVAVVSFVTAVMKS